MVQADQAVVVDSVAPADAEQRVTPVYDVNLGNRNPVMVTY